MQLVHDAGGSLAPGGRVHYRAVFISDVHLGTRACRADLLAAFLKSCTCDHLYLVGDIVDGWRLRRSWYWDRQHDRVLRRVIKAARSGAQVTYIPGNHDEAARGWIRFGIEVAGVRMARDAIYVAADGQRYLVLHGDQFDVVIRYGKFLAHLGDRGYAAALEVNRWFNVVRRKFGYPYRSLSKWLKRHVKEAVKVIADYETAAVREASGLGAAGVICGHIHTPVITRIDGLAYMNCGDWVESCTALAEHPDGRWEIVRWTEAGRADESVPRHAARPDAVLAAP
jgi:UDP-2,3-diacylglucosamine pyrophosphatase LpxH